MLIRTVRAALLALAVSSVGVIATSQAAEPTDPAVDDAPSITEITTRNDGGGLTAYVPLYTNVVVSFTDPTPSKPKAYRVQVAGVGTFANALPDDTTDGDLEIAVSAYELPVGEEVSYVVKEVRDGAVVSKSAPATFTFSYVKHPRKLLTSSEKVDGVWSYYAGDTAKFRFKGEWAEGTRFSTQVWVSKGKKFTGDDYAYNVYKDGALVSTSYVAKPVMSVKIPKDLAGRYLWVSVLGWKEGKGGWVFEIPVEKVIRR